MSIAAKNWVNNPDFFLNKSAVVVYRLCMDSEALESDVDDILGHLQEGLKRTEVTMTSILEGILVDSASLMTELEAALNDVEAALLKD